MRGRKGNFNLIFAASMLIGVMGLLWAPSASAFNLQWVEGIDTNLLQTTDPSFFAQEWSRTLPGWDIVEGKRAYNEWLVDGAANKTGYDTNTSKLWLLFGNAYTDLTTATDAVVFLMHGDSNDGYANFYVDNQLVYQNYDLYDDGASGEYLALIVSDLTFGLHSLKVERAGIKNPSSSGYDVAIIGGGALNASSVPIPGAVWLFGSGLVGLVGLRRKLKS